jgi:hypothetical protein
VDPSLSKTLAPGLDRLVELVLAIQELARRGE